MSKYDISEDTKQVFLKGKIKWANGLFQVDEQYNRWGCKLYPDDESLEIIRELQKLGLKNQVKVDDDGSYTSLNRPTQKLMRGAVKAFTPPVVEDNEGVPLTTGIGNGSDVIAKMEVYKYMKPGSKKWEVAYRLAAVKVVNLVPYERESNFTDAEKKQSAGITEQEFNF